MSKEELMKELEKKRIQVLKEIKPICEAFNLEYDYIVSTEGQTETLILNSQKIGCSQTSISAIINEVIGYIFVKIYCRYNWIGPFRTQTLNVIKQYWLD